MTHAPVTLFHPEYGDFLYAAVREGGTDAPLSVLSALARLGVDPWDEAAYLSGLSLAAANVRLTALLARLPINPIGAGTSIINTARLLQLLPQQGERTRTVLDAAPAKGALLQIFAALLVCAVIVASLLSMRNDPGEGQSTGIVSGSSSTR